MDILSKEELQELPKIQRYMYAATVTFEEICSVVCTESNDSHCKGCKIRLLSERATYYSKMGFNHAFLKQVEYVINNQQMLVKEQLDQRYGCKKRKEMAKYLYQYGTSKPAESEEEAFLNWCRDNFAIKEEEEDD